MAHAKTAVILSKRKRACDIHGIFVRRFYILFYLNSLKFL